MTKEPRKKRIVILGSTGSIGTQTLQCLQFFENQFEIVGLACHSSRKLFDEQVREWNPGYSIMTSSIRDPQMAIKELIQRDDVDVVVNALSGIAGVNPTIEALEAGKIVLLANKESMVMRGAEVMRIAKECSGIGAKIIPLDSEAAGLWQLLRCNHSHVEKSAVSNLCPSKKSQVSKFFITASGGPFFGFSREGLSKVTVDDALNHPTWKMGKKITIDSSTLMNKAFELIECSNLFDIPVEKINVVVDRASSVHAGVEYIDGTQEWVVYPPDMRTPITDALTHLANGVDGEGVELPEYIPSLPKTDRVHRSIKLGNFDSVDEKVFPALELARSASAFGQAACAQLCEKNEIAVHKFLRGEVSFTDLLNVADHTNSTNY